MRFAILAIAVCLGFAATAVGQCFTSRTATTHPFFQQHKGGVTFRDLAAQRDFGFVRRGQNTIYVGDFLGLYGSKFNKFGGYGFGQRDVYGDDLLYGLSYKSNVDTYASQAIDAAAYLAAAQEFIKASQKNFARSFELFNATTREAAQRQHEIELIRAKQQFAEQMLKLLQGFVPGEVPPKPSPSDTPKAPTPKTPAPKPKEMKPIDLPAGLSASAKVGAIVAARCVSCHGGGAPRGGLSLENLGTLDPSYESKILNRITTGDASLRMPPGGSLPFAEIAAFFAAARPTASTE